MVDLNKVDPLTMASPIGHTGDGTAQKKDITPSSFLIRQWQLIRQFVNGVGTNLAALIAAVARIDATVITAGVALSGGGAIGNGNMTIDLDNTAVTPGTYGDDSNVGQFTVDQQGRITSASNVAIATSPSGGQWSIAASHDFAATPAATFDVTGLNSADIMIIVDAVTGAGGAGTGLRTLLLSVDNGSTFYNTLGNYSNIPVNGVANTQVSIPLHGTASPAAKTAFGMILGANVSGDPKIIETNSDRYIFKASTSPIDAIRLSNPGGGNMNGGVIYVLVRS